MHAVKPMNAVAPKYAHNGFMYFGGVISSSTSLSSFISSIEYNSDCVTVDLLSDVTESDLTTCIKQEKLQNSEKEKSQIKQENMQMQEKLKNPEEDKKALQKRLEEEASPIKGKVSASV